MDYETKELSSRPIQEVASLRKVESIITHFSHGFDKLSRVIYLQEQTKFLTLFSEWNMMIWDAVKHKPLRKLNGQVTNMMGLLELKDGRLASCSEGDAIKIWNIYTGKMSKKYSEL